MWATAGIKISASSNIPKKIATTKYVHLKYVLKDTEEAVYLEKNEKEEKAANLFIKRKMVIVTSLVLKRSLRA